MVSGSNTENIFRHALREGEAALLIVDESLETRTASLCDLLVAINSGSIQLALKEKKSQRILALENFRFTDSKKEYNWTNMLEHVSGKSHLLRNYEFSKSVIGVFTPYYTCVPDALFKKGDERTYLEFNFGNSMSGQRLMSTQLDTLQVNVVFGVPEDLNREIQHLFEDPQIVHLSSTLLESTLLNSRTRQEKDMFLHVRKDHLDVLVMEGKNLLLINTYPCAGPEDILYFALMVCDQLGLDPDSLMVRLAGEAEKESAIYKLLYRYFRNLQFAQAPATIKFTYNFGKKSLHPYISLFSLALCES
jgi:hypothetical protein